MFLTASYNVLLAKSPKTLLRSLKPALPNPITTPTLQTYRSLTELKRVQNWYKPGPQAAVRMIFINLVRSALPQPSDNIVEVAVVWFQFFGRGTKGAFHRYRAFSREIFHQFTELEGVTGRRGTVAESALGLFDVEVDEVLLDGA